MKFHQRCAGAALFAIALGASTFSHAASVSGQGTWETTLQGRDLDSNLSTFEAYYDTTLNITWLADANYAGVTMIWADATNWAANLNINGYTGWRLPTVTDTGTPGCNYASSGTDCGYNVDTTTGEMAHMYYTTLGNLGFADSAGNSPQPGFGLSNTGPFSNLEPAQYWTSTQDALFADNAWIFHYGIGAQYGVDTTIGENFNAWAVHSGDVGVSAVPVPAAVWLFGTGLVGLIGFARHRKRVT